MIRSHLIKFFKDKLWLQFLVLLFSIICCSLFSFLFINDLSNCIYSLEKNTEEVASDSTLLEVYSYSINSDGTVSFKLQNGDSYESQKVIFCLIYDTDKDLTYYSAEDSVIITEVSDSFFDDFIWGTKYLVVLGFSFLMLLLAYLLRDRDYVLLSKPYIKYIYLATFILVLFVGVLASASLSKF